MRNNPDFPSFPVFLVLFGTTLGVLFFLPGQSGLYGIILVLWACFALFRGVWSLETAFLLEDSEKDQKSMVLPWVILRSMDLRARLDMGFAAMRAADSVLIVCAVLCVLYAAWVIFVGLNPMQPDAIRVVQADILNFFERFTQIFPAQKDISVPVFIDVSLVPIVRIGLIGLCFWLVRSYVLTLEHTRILVGFCAGSLTLSLGAAFFQLGWASGPLYLEGSWKGYGSGLSDVMLRLGVLEPQNYSSFFIRSAELGVGGAVFLYMPAVLIGCVLLRNCAQDAPKRNYALMGLAVLALLLGADLFFAAGSALLGVFMSGWALVAALWQLSFSAAKKTHTLRQI